MTDALHPSDVRQLTDTQLQEITAAEATYQKYAHVLSAVRKELARREALRHQPDQDDYRHSSEFRQLRDAYLRAIKRCQEVARGATLAVTVPLVLTLRADVDVRGRVLEYLPHRLFVHAVKARVGAEGALTVRQRALLQVGAEAVVEFACKDVVGLFPDFVKERDAATAEVNRLLAEGAAHGLDLEMEG